MTAKSFLSSVVLLILSVAFFSFAHPGLVFVRGFFLFGWLSYIPVFLLVRRCTVRSAFAWGAAYGFLRFGVLMFWLFRYSLGGFLGMSFAMAAETAVLFALCVVIQKILVQKFLVWGGRVAVACAWLVPPVLFLLFDWLRTLGELGFSYGVIGYSQWQIAPLLRTARGSGVWGITFVIMLFGAVVAECIDTWRKISTDGTDDGTDTDDADTITQKKMKNLVRGNPWVNARYLLVSGRNLRGNARYLCNLWITFIRHVPRLCVFAGCFLILLVSGFFPRVQAAETRSLAVALIQPNADPWKNGVAAYREELHALISLTDQALAEQPETQLVVWSETAFVPDITWHYTERTDAERFALVSELLAYIESKNCAFVLGNNHASRGEDGTVQSYNSALYFEPHTNVFPPRPVVYSKMRLVPFSEQVPYPRVFAPFARLFDPEPHYWDAGTDATLFETAGVQFCTPICFEDTFAPDIKTMCRRGARLIVNLSNDSWSHSRACQNQHVAMAVFRSAENGVPSIRSTASGETCVIDERGRVVAALAPFVAGYLCATVTVKK